MLCGTAFVMCVLAIWFARAGTTFGSAQPSGPLVLATLTPSVTGRPEAPPGVDAEEAASLAAVVTTPLGASSAHAPPQVTDPAATGPPITAPQPGSPLDTAAPPAQLSTSGPPASGSQTSWPDLLASLDTDRSAAFAACDATLLREVYTAGSAPFAEDTSLIADLAAQDVHAVGLRLEIDDVTVVSAGLDSTTLRVVDLLPPYELVDTAGHVVSTEPGRGLRTWLLTLAAEEDGWRISAIAPG